MNTHLLPSIELRNIELADNARLAAIIRQTLTEFGADKPGTVYFDPTTDHLFELFAHPLAAYFVVLMDGELMGGGGIFPTAGLPDGTCELVKMYLLPQARGKGLAQKVIHQCLQKARALGFEKVYLETLPELEQALRVYEKIGFQYLNGPLGESGHFACSKWMLIDL